ncbi:MAG: response regulator transcription factor [Micromonosporaceae bacterium]|nr:response regulator transcription factor [Micromonosporaceae bacterium]
MERITVVIMADDPILELGIASQLRQQPDIQLTDAGDATGARVVLVAADQVTERTLQVLRSHRRNGTKLVLVVSDVADSEFAGVVETGVSGVVRRREATSDRLATAIRAAAVGEGTLPPDLLGRLLGQLGHMCRKDPAARGLRTAGLLEREIKVLRLVAEGKDTAEIAAELSYSQRTVKNVMHDITSRLHLQNRAHAVAYALKEGLL